MLKKTFLKIIAMAGLSFSTLAMADIMYKFFRSWDEVVEFCENNHCISVSDIYGREFPTELYMVTYDDSNSEPGCAPDMDGDGNLTCRPIEPPPREPDD
ncbi:hypothetical protein [Aliikangiella sp. G2MR2-5]|uniref:hypothetical protein n=1 Tax=Aliikangiella sp. G2MR2-5 TaxID=2788943 RepID=UPI0018AC7281|nr:hypothetical protein [Aliikangiella sp. G2MR2-5]